MKLPRKEALFTIVLIGAFIAMLLSFWLMYQSGCAGDIKTGSYGNPIEALRIESIAMNVVFLSAFLVSSAYYLNSKESVVLRILGILAIMAGMFFVLYIPNVYFQGLGVTSCQ